MRSFCCFFCFRTMKISCSYLFYFYLIPLLRKYIHTLSSPTYHICSALQFLLRFFFTIQYTLFYSIPRGEFRFLKRNSHRKIPNIDFELNYEARH